MIPVAEKRIILSRLGVNSPFSNSGQNVFVFLHAHSFILPISAFLFYHGMKDKMEKMKLSRGRVQLFVSAPAMCFSS